MTEEAYNLFQTSVSPFGVTVTREKAEQFGRYMELLLEWNQKMNLTAITDEKEVIIKHFADSLTILPFVLRSGAKTLADVGTGAGFPGLPLSIFCPDLSVTLVDSLGKRIHFLSAVQQELNLRSLSLLHLRAEDMGIDQHYRERFDLVTARAVAPMPVLLEYCLPLVRQEGYFIAMKGGRKEEDGQKAADILGGKLESKDEFFLQGDEETYQRNVFYFRKFRHTPTKYPRKAGIAAKKPLL